MWYSQPEKGNAPSREKAKTCREAARSYNTMISDIGMVLSTFSDAYNTASHHILNNDDDCPDAEGGLLT
jgi:hypothetical protein